jgi:hypothetical protein
MVRCRIWMERRHPESLCRIAASLHRGASDAVGQVRKLPDKCRIRTVRVNMLCSSSTSYRIPLFDFEGSNYALSLRTSIRLAAACTEISK